MFNKVLLLQENGIVELLPPFLIKFPWMLQATVVGTENELMQIHRLNRKNLKQNLSPVEREKEGFVTWLYPIELLKQMHDFGPSVIVKNEDKVVAYALTTPKEALVFYADFQNMVDNLQPLKFNNRRLSSYMFYCMGQIFIDVDCRGKEVFNILYAKHKEIYSGKYACL